METRIDGMLRDVMHALGVIGREHRVVGRFDDLFVERREDFRARQIDRRRAGGGEDFLDHAFRRPHFQALEVGDAAQRTGGDEGFEPRRGRADEMQPIGMQQLVHQLLAAAVIDEAQHFRRGRPRADRVGDQAERRVFACEIRRVGDVAAEDA